MEPNFIAASWFVSFGYCEYKFYLEKVVKVKIPVNEAMKIGLEVHEQKEEEFLEAAVPTSWEEFLKSKDYTITKEVNLSTKYETTMIAGRVDEIGVDNKGIYIIDDKPRAKPYLGTKNQLFAYCYMFKRNFSDKTPKPIYAVLRDRDTNVEVWKESFSLSTEFNFINQLNRIKKVLNEEIPAIPTDNANKCATCPMKKLNVCQFAK